jgi:small subunit ribosomal protein S4
VDIPQFQLKAGDKVSLHEGYRPSATVKRALENLQKRTIPQWLEVDPGTFTGTFKKIPAKDEIALPVQEQLIVELYSK